MKNMVALVMFESVSWTDERAVELQRILEEDLHGRYFTDQFPQELMDRFL